MGTTEGRKRAYYEYQTGNIGDSGVLKLEMTYLDLCEQFIQENGNSDLSLFELEPEAVQSIIHELQRNEEFGDLNRRKNGRLLRALNRYAAFCTGDPDPIENHYNKSSEKAEEGITGTTKRAGIGRSGMKSGNAGPEINDSNAEEAPPKYFTDGKRKTGEQTRTHLSSSLEELLTEADPGNAKGIPVWKEPELAPSIREDILRTQREKEARDLERKERDRKEQERKEQESEDQTRREQDRRAYEPAGAVRPGGQSISQIQLLQEQINLLQRQVWELQNSGRFSRARAMREQMEVLEGQIGTLQTSEMPVPADQQSPQIDAFSNPETTPESGTAEKAVSEAGNPADPAGLKTGEEQGTNEAPESIEGPTAKAEPGPSAVEPSEAGSSEPEVTAPRISPLDDPNFVPRSMKILFGQTIGTGKPEKYYWEPNNTSRVFHMNTGIIGTMGTGKTQFTKSLIAQLMMRAGDNFDGTVPGLLIFDYKGDYNESKMDFVQAVNARVLKPYHLPFNPFSMAETRTFRPLLPTHTANAFKDILAKVYRLGPKQQSSLFQCIMAAYESRGIKSVDSVTWKQTPPTFADVFGKYEKDENIPKNDSLAAAMNKLKMFELFEPDPAKTGSLFDMLRGTVVVDLSGYDPDIQSLVVAITLQLFYTQMVASGSSMLKDNLRQVTRMVLVDEADNFMSEDFPALKKILKEGREFGVGVVLSTQSLKHFQTDDNSYADYIMTWVVHNVADLKDKDVDFVFRVPPKGLQETELLRKVKQLEKFQSIVKVGNEAPVCLRDLAFWELMKKKDEPAEPEEEGAPSAEGSEEAGEPDGESAVKAGSDEAAEASVPDARPGEAGKPAEAPAPDPEPDEPIEPPAGGPAYMG